MALTAASTVAWGFEDEPSASSVVDVGGAATGVDVEDPLSDWSMIGTSDEEREGEVAAPPAPPSPSPSSLSAGASRHLYHYFSGHPASSVHVGPIPAFRTLYHYFSGHRAGPVEPDSPVAPPSTEAPVVNRPFRTRVGKYKRMRIVAEAGPIDIWMPLFGAEGVFFKPVLEQCKIDFQDLELHQSQWFKLPGLFLPNFYVKSVVNASVIAQFGV